MEEEEEEEEAAECKAPREGSLRWHIWRALGSGRAEERQAVVDRVGKGLLTPGQKPFSRNDVVTILGKEKGRRGAALWSQIDGGRYQLTEGGRDLLPAAKKGGGKKRQKA